METLGMPDDMPIEHGMISKSIERAQHKVEKHHFSMQLKILQYDDVINKQRETIYTLRYRILSKHRLNDMVKDNVRELLEGMIGPQAAKELQSIESRQELVKDLQHYFPIKNLDDVVASSYNKAEFIDELVKVMFSFYEFKINEYPEGLFEEIVTKGIFLTTLDRKWMDHLHNMDILREGIGLRAWGQRDPLMEYKKAFDMFEKLLFSIAEESILTINRATLVKRENVDFHRIC